MQFLWQRILPKPGSATLTAVIVRLLIFFPAVSCPGPGFARRVVACRAAVTGRGASSVDVVAGMTAHLSPTGQKGQTGHGTVEPCWPRGQERGSRRSR
jgi:hypothetical protein